jgi:hypothetical protein
MDADVITRNDPIGSYSWDASYVYQQKDHEIYRQWVALVNEKDPEDNTPKGYMKISVVVSGPGDRPKIHNIEKEMKEEEEKEKAAVIIYKCCRVN